MSFVNVVKFKFASINSLGFFNFSKKVTIDVRGSYYSGRPNERTQLYRTESLVRQLPKQLHPPPSPTSIECLIEDQAISSPTLFPSPVSKLDRRHIGRPRKRVNLLTGEGGGGIGGVKS